MEQPAIRAALNSVGEVRATLSHLKNSLIPEVNDEMVRRCIEVLETAEVMILNLAELLETRELPKG